VTPEVSIEPIPRPDLYRLARSEAPRNVKPKTAAVNFLRHKKTDYESELRRIPNKGNALKWTWFCRRLLRGRIYCEIAQAYPFLAGECLRQARFRGCAQQYQQAREGYCSVQ
jgi:hypothetical protein